MLPAYAEDFMSKFRFLILPIIVALAVVGFSHSGWAQGRWYDWIQKRQEKRREAYQELRNQTQNVSDSSSSAQNVQYTLLHDGIRRKYLVHLPPSYNPNQSWPAVIFLHGGGGSLKGVSKEGMDKAADRLGFILLAPAGTGPIPDRALTWNSGQWETGECCGYAVTHNIDDVGFISQMIDEVKTKYNIDATRIYATGISNGGMMSYLVGMKLSDKIAAIAPVAPPAIPSGVEPGRPISVLHVHGTADPCAPYNGGMGGGCMGKNSKRFTAQSARQMVDYWIQKDNCPTRGTTTYQKGNATSVSYGPGTNNTTVEFCTLQGGGHAWPDGDQYFSVEKIGPVSHDYSFDQMWEFLKKQKLPS
jgi:polyhydroxybutyrate depolymerase